MKKANREEVVMDRRRNRTDRRSENAAESAPASTERRRVQRRRQIDPTTCERDYSSDEIEFMRALDAYKRRSGRMFPTCSEILEVIRELGYVRLESGESAAEEEVPSGVEAAAGVGVEQGVAAPLAGEPNGECGQ